jgi:hypothetical protein
MWKDALKACNLVECYLSMGNTFCSTVISVPPLNLSRYSIWLYFTAELCVYWFNLTNSSEISEVCVCVCVCVCFTRQSDAIFMYKDIY